MCPSRVGQAGASQSVVIIARQRNKVKYPNDLRGNKAPDLYPFVGDQRTFRIVKQCREKSRMFASCGMWNALVMR